jgi:hypothetical protein
MHAIGAKASRNVARRNADFRAGGEQVTSRDGTASIFVLRKWTLRFIAPGALVRSAILSI